MAGRLSSLSALTDEGLAWIVTGPLGRGLAFSIDFTVALRIGLARRR